MTDLACLRREQALLPLQVLLRLARDRSLDGEAADQVQRPVPLLEALRCGGCCDAAAKSTGQPDPASHRNRWIEDAQFGSLPAAEPSRAGGHAQPAEHRLVRGRDIVSGRRHGLPGGQPEPLRTGRHHPVHPPPAHARLANEEDPPLDCLDCPTAIGVTCHEVRQTAAADRRAGPARHEQPDPIRCRIAAAHDPARPDTGQRHPASVVGNAKHEDLTGDRLEHLARAELPGIRPGQFGGGSRLDAHPDLTSSA
ncbi:unannotated protein [freshwater metagenome]|uniref:Unannotated protein n=1 Tax=freshwater metagenome TaxID=449393 RepID=A0A6J7EVH3_9ZZZZ